MRSVFFCSFALLVFFCSCTTTTKTATGPQTIASINFNDASETDNWNLTSNFGNTNLDTTIKYEGKSSFHLLPHAGCYTLDRKLGIPVTQNSNYKIEFNLLMDSTQIPLVFCAGSFMIRILQGNDELLLQDYEDAPAWETKSAYFKAKSDLPVNVNLIVGKQVWIDNMIFIQEL
jgi:hypothetical protein